ncbi:hypothetical protein NMG60_11006748 [Bertholletia excelsa]
MASILQKLLKKQSSNYVIPSFSRPQLPNILPPILTRLPHEPRSSESLPQHPHILNFVPLLGPPKTGDSVLRHSNPIFPSFPFWFSPNPALPYDPDDAVSVDATAIWADSVKRKRKKKMNKHKYKKLRKRLRKRT